VAPEENNLSEQPNQGKFNEYFTDFHLAKLPAGVEFNPFGIIRTSVFTAGEQFCTDMSIKKDIPAGNIGSAVYDINTNKTSSQKACSSGIKTGWFSWL